jgi:hypothetical protein
MLPDRRAKQSFAWLIERHYNQAFVQTLRRRKGLLGGNESGHHASNKVYLILIDRMAHIRVQALGNAPA